MCLEEVIRLLEGELVVSPEGPSCEVCGAAAADLMSDVLRNPRPCAVLLTGLTTAQAVRTASLADYRAIIFVRGKQPTQEILELAREEGLPVVLTRLSMFEACGRLHGAGLRPKDDPTEE